MNLNLIKATLAKATPGPWEYSYEYDEISPSHDSHGDFAICKEIKWYDNGILISRAPEWIAFLVAQLEEAQKTLEAIANMPPHPPMARAKAKLALKRLKGEQAE